MKVAKVGKGLFLILRIVCYLALALVVGSPVALVAALTFGGCTQNGDWIACTSSVAQGAANAANITLLTSVFTGVPVLLSLGGIFFLIRAALRRRKRNQDDTPVLGSYPIEIPPPIQRRSRCGRRALADLRHR